MENTRGSEWRRWDLHLHTASSYDYKYKGDNPDEKLVETLKNHNISVAAITDHFVIDKARIENLRKLAPEIVFFPGVELRTDKGGSNIHPIIIFDNNINLDEITAEFYHFKKHSAKDKDDNEKIRWNYDDIVKFAHDNNGIITIHAGSKKNGIDEQISNVLPVKIATKNEYATTVNILEIGKLEDINEYETYKFPTIGYKPLIMGSDNHNPNKYPNDHNSTLYTWIKADPTFEGLKQTIYEPKTRVKIQQLRPDDKNNSQIIDSITLKEDGFWDNTIFFNDNLNVIIGGRSTGKSTLLKSIAYNTGLAIKSDENVFVRSHIDGVSINWKDNLKGHRYIQFIQQNYMFAIAKNEKNELNNLIERIFRNMPEKKYFEEYVEKNKEIEKYIRINLIDLSYLHADINKLEQQLRIKGNKYGIEKEISRLEQQIENSLSNISLSDKEVESYYKIVKEIETIKHQITQNNNDIQILKSIQKHSMLNDDITFEIGKLSFENKIAVSNSYVQLKAQIQEQWNNLIIEHFNIITTKIEALNHTINALEGNAIFQKCSDAYTKDIEILNIQTKLKEEINKLQEIIELEGKIRISKQKEESLLLDIVRKHLEYKINTNELTKKIIINHDDINISTTIIFDEENFEKTFGYSLIHHDKFREIDPIYQMYATYATNNDDPSLIYDRLAYLFRETSDYWADYGDDKLHKDYEKIITTNWFKYKFEIKYQNDNFEQMSPGKKAFVILKLLLEFDKKTCPILIDQPEDSLDNRTIYKELVEYIKDKKTKRQIILVTHNPNVVVGADAENVIVANQHGEDSPNNNGIKFQYVNGSLENTKTKDDRERKKNILNSQGIREHICEILEGGDDAFKKREMKYGLK